MERLNLRLKSVLGLTVLLISGTAAAGAQEERRPVLLFDYALSNPAEDVLLPVVPTLGASVPASVQLVTAEGVEDPVYGYFYYQGRPVIVELATRSIVRIGN